MKKSVAALSLLAVFGLALQLSGFHALAFPLPILQGAGARQQDGSAGVQATLTAVMGEGAIHYSLTLKNNTREEVSDLEVVLPVPARVADVKIASTPHGATFEGLDGGNAAWHLDRLPTQGSAGPFAYWATVPGATPDPAAASVRWTRPQEGTAISEPASPTVAALPPGTVQISQVIEGMGEHWAKPEDAPFGPLYGVYGGRIIFIEYMIPQSDFTQGVDHTEMPGDQGLPPIDHFDLEFQPNGHEGYPIPHYDLHGYMVPHAEHLAIHP